jgi:hypothetical protein
LADLLGHGRKWRKVDALMSLKYQTRVRASWQELYIERARIEKAYFHNPNVPDELKNDELAQANFLFTGTQNTPHTPHTTRSYESFPGR